MGEGFQTPIEMHPVVVNMAGLVLRGHNGGNNQHPSTTSSSCPPEAPVTTVVVTTSSEAPDSSPAPSDSEGPSNTGDTIVYGDDTGAVPATPSPATSAPKPKAHTPSVGAHTGNTLPATGNGNEAKPLGIAGGLSGLGIAALILAARRRPARANH